MITYIQFKNGVMAFLDKEMIAKIDNQLLKVGAISTLFIMDKKADNIFNNLKEEKIVKYLNLIDMDGNIDDDTLLDAIKKGMGGKTMSFNTGLLGTLTIFPEDVDKLRSYLRAEQTTIPTEKVEQLPLV